MTYCEECGRNEATRLVTLESGARRHCCTECWGTAMLVSVARECGWSLMTIGDDVRVDLVVLGEPEKVESHQQVLAASGVASQIDYSASPEESPSSTS